MFRRACGDYSCAFLLHTRLRVHQTPGIPCALLFRRTSLVKGSDALRREKALSRRRLALPYSVYCSLLAGRQGRRRAGETPWIGTSIPNQRCCDARRRRIGVGRARIFGKVVLKREIDADQLREASNEIEIHQ
jgi:hypothetical protein